MCKFTDLLDEYFEAREDYKAAKENYSGYDFEYFYHNHIDRLNKATDALNEAFEKVVK